MKILWLVNVKLPIIYRASGEENETNVGGWLDQISERLLEENSLLIIYPTQNKHGESGKKDKLSYYSIYFESHKMNAGKLNEADCIEVFEKIIKEEKPDVIHVHGTEFQYSYFMTEAAKRVDMIDRLVISIQGMVGFYAEHYEFGIPYVVRYAKTIKEIVLNRSLHAGKIEFVRRGMYEAQAIRNAKYISGRTNWDKGCVSLINPKATYLKCNETLRTAFYTGEWTYEKCEPHSIFVSQATYPVKGFHLLLKALAIVKRDYPDMKVRVAGADITKGNIINGSAYTAYIKRLIKKYDLKENIEFLGSQNVEQMKQNMLRTNVFVSPSTIENSPNSLGEGMILGVPCISSDVGGVTNLMLHNEEGYVYPLDETYMLAYYIMDIFANSEKATTMGQKARKHAKKTHDADMNFSQLVEIYRLIKGGIT